MSHSSSASARYGTLAVLTLLLIGCSTTPPQSPASPSPPPASPPPSPPTGSQLGTLLVVNKGSNTLSLVDGATATELTTISTGSGPHEVAVSPDGLTAYVSDYGFGPAPGNTITEIDLVGWAVVRTIDLGGNSLPHGIQAASDGHIWVTTEGSSRVLEVDDVTGAILQIAGNDQADAHMLVLIEQRDRLFTGNIGRGTSTAIDTRNGTVIAQIPTGAGAEGVDASPDGEHVYVSNRSAGTLTEIDVATARVTRSLPVGDFPIRVKVRPDGSEALVSDLQGNELVAVDLASWQVVRRLTVPTPIGLLITPDNRIAYVAATSQDRIAVVDLDAWSVVAEIAVGDNPDGLAWVSAP
jgi:YVTN family beta-propeller protein